MADTWIDWGPKLGRPTNGPSGAVAAIRLRSGDEVEAPRESAWTHVGSRADIVAYRPA